ncbi:MAG: sulfatase/phosphatase domain-containing protein, partial [Pseudomonadota bacterium]
LAENTIFVFSSDNGGAGYIGLPEINAPYRGWKQTLYEGGIRVPLFMRWPAQIEPGTVDETPVAHIDVMPTLAAAAQASLPQGVEIDGVNLLPLATGDGAIERPNDAIFWQSGDYHVVRAGDWKLQRGGLEDQLALFDLASDPTEQVNVAADQPEKTAELVALLDAHQAGRKEPVYPGVVGGVVMVDKTMAETYEPGDEYVIWAN